MPKIWFCAATERRTSSRKIAPTSSICFSRWRAIRSRQIAYYHPGLGTMEPPVRSPGGPAGSTRVWAWPSAMGSKPISATRMFPDEQLRGRRPHLPVRLQPGAYTVRAVASLLHMYGLIPNGNEALVPYAIRMLMAIQKIDGKRGNRTAEEESYFTLARDFKGTFSTRDCKPWFVGVWDTVSSVGW